ncbi:HAMP domain-containing histidine kinase [Hymenobacter sp. DH14]|uniref:histidine kinase n=1 Tax=Hymenobacter cyanobacteriorum TaxID=2926463 RepID=A0A9X1VH72_9BACT|nr:HAMP domain-containing sensor histidine kinase [Hymenobacter cyanobacteriorum]MCI1188192.1 HAMP domain-containing histidine kinase [Hymenobacter cyanobacteriorum]
MKLLARTTVVFLIYASVVAAAGTFVYYNFIRKIYYQYVDRTLSRRKLRVDNDLRLYLRSPADLDFWHKLDHNVEFVPLAAPGPPAAFSVRMMYNKLVNKTVPYRQLAAPVMFQGQPYRLELRTTMLDSQELLARIGQAGALLFGALLVGLLVLQHVLARRLWGPFYHTLGELQKYKLDQPEPVHLAPTRIPEFKALNAAIGRVLHRNQRIYHRQKEFTENAAHELQTPLAILRTKLDMLVQAPGLTEEQASHIEPLLDVTQRLTHLSRSLLLLAHLDQQLFFPTETVDVAATIRTQLGQLREQLAGAGLTLSTEIVPALPLAANRSLLDILVSNLLSNAIRHNVAGGVVRVALTPDLLTVENTGRSRALPADQLFVRFRPGPERAPGSVGLGLAIARQVCETYGFLLSYHYEEPGRHQMRVRLG